MDLQVSEDEHQAGSGYCILLSGGGRQRGLFSRPSWELSGYREQPTKFVAADSTN